MNRKNLNLALSVLMTLGIFLLILNRNREMVIMVSAQMFVPALDSIVKISLKQHPLRSPLLVVLLALWHEIMPLISRRNNHCYLLHRFFILFLIPGNAFNVGPTLIKS